MTIDSWDGVLMVLIWESDGIDASKWGVGVDDDILVADKELVPFKVWNNSGCECYQLMSAMAQIMMRFDRTYRLHHPSKPFAYQPDQQHESRAC